MSTASLSDGAGRETTVGSFPAIGTSLWPTGLIAVLVLGFVLRLIWIGDIEYKLDESWTFAQVQQIRQGAPVPAFGMPTSQGFLNPGLSLWVFLPLAELIQAQSPPDLARAVQISNVLALLGLVAFGLWIVPRAEREVWLWSAALVSVNPLAVLFQRKIWPPSVFPILIVLFLVSWWHRERRAGALSWGLIGAALGQINGPGFFFAAGFALWAFLFDRKRVKWGSWFVGSCLGVVPMLAWLHYMLTDPHRLPVRRLISNALEGKFWIRWTLEPLGFGLDYSLEDDFFDFLRHPLVGAQPTYLMLLLHVLLGILGIWIAFLALTRLRSNWTLRSASAAFIGRESATAFTQNAALWGYGLLLAASCLPVHRHYMIILFPLQFVWLARLALGNSAVPARDADRGRALLAALVVCQGLISLQFLNYVHTQPTIHGDYGVPYREQIRLEPQTSRTGTTSSLAAPLMSERTC